MLRFGALVGQGIGCISLAYPSEGGLTHAGLALCSRDRELTRAAARAKSGRPS